MSTSRSCSMNSSSPQLANRIPQPPPLPGNLLKPQHAVNVRRTIMRPDVVYATPTARLLPQNKEKAFVSYLFSALRPFSSATSSSNSGNCSSISPPLYAHNVTRSQRDDPSVVENRHLVSVGIRFALLNGHISFVMRLLVGLSDGG